MSVIGQIPKYRILWTWDYCTFWDDSFYARGIGAGGFNDRRSHFLRDYKRMVDFCAERGINGIVVWGALRTYNDGVAQFRELVKYGKHKGVRILPGVGVFSYGGIYYDTRANDPLFGISFIDSKPEKNPYALQSWLTEHPELSAVDPDGKPRYPGVYGAVACPSKRENLIWFKHAFEWLCTEFQIEGAQIEVGDYAACHCKECKKRRDSAAGSSFQIEDMIEPYAAAYDIAKKANPDAWVICETYSSFALPEPKDKSHTFGSTLGTEQKNMLAQLNSGAIIQWVMDGAIGDDAAQEWNGNVVLPSKNNIVRIHAGSKWHANGIEGWAVNDVGDMVKKARSSGINGVSIFGQESPASPPNEANYLVFSEFCGMGNNNPGCDFNAFYANTLDPLYGGSGMSDEWRRIYGNAQAMRLDKENRDMNAYDKQRQMAGLAEKAHGISSKMSGEICRRWVWLENWLWRAEYLYRTIV